jgi:hypothetical protein
MEPGEEEQAMKGGIKLNLIIDVLMALLMAAVIGLGFLMKSVLLSGQECWVVYGRKVDLLWLGLDRHGWGAVHLALGLALLALVVLHVILRWELVLSMFRQALEGGAGRAVIGALILAACLVLLGFPFFASPEVRELRQGEGHDAHSRRSREMRGSMTLREVAAENRVRTDYLKKSLGLPVGTDDGERLGQLRKRHEFQMSDVQTAIDQCSQGDENSCRAGGPAN